MLHIHHSFIHLPSVTYTHIHTDSNAKQTKQKTT